MTGWKAALLTMVVKRHRIFTLHRLIRGLWPVGLTLNGSVEFHGFVIAPAGTVTLNANSSLNGGVFSDRLTINGHGRLVEP